MARTKQVVPAMSDNLWQIFERVGAPIQSFAANFGPKQYVWTLLDVHEGATKEEVANGPQIPCQRMPLKVDDPVMIILIILMGQPQPPPDHEELHPPVARLRVRELSPTVTIPHRLPAILRNLAECHAGTSRYDFPRPKCYPPPNDRSRARKAQRTPRRA